MSNRATRRAARVAAIRLGRLRESERRRHWLERRITRILARSPRPKITVAWQAAGILGL